MAVNLPFDAQRANTTIMNVVLMIATTVFVFLGAVTASTTRIKVLDAASANRGLPHCARIANCCAVPTDVQMNWRMVFLHGAPIADPNDWNAKNALLLIARNLSKTKHTKYCEKHRNRNTRCARCSVKALEGGAKTFCLDCKEKFRKEMEEALSLSLS